MRTHFYLIAILFAGVLFSSQPCYAQRQTPGRGSVDGTFFMDLTGGVRPTGGRLTYSSYGFNHHLSFGLDVLYRPNQYTEPDVYDPANPTMVVLPGEVHQLPSYEIVALAGYKYRFWNTRNRSFILSAGAYIGLGIQYCREMAQYVKEQDVDNVKNFGEAGFVAQMVPEVTFEWFPLNNVSLFASFDPKVYFVNALGGDKRPWIRLFLGFGTKYYL